MRIKKQKTSDIVELADRSVWRIWPADIPKTLLWLPRTDVAVVEIEHEVCSHALLDRSTGVHVRVIDARECWPVDMVRQLLSTTDTSSDLAGRPRTVDGFGPPRIVRREVVSPRSIE